MGNDGKPVFLSNHAAASWAGSPPTAGRARFAVKPTSSILTPRRTIDRYATRRGSRQGPSDRASASARCDRGGHGGLRDCRHYLRQRGQMGEGPAWPFRRRRLRRAGHVNDIHQRVETILAAFAGRGSSWSPMTTDREKRGRFSSPPRTARREERLSIATRQASCVRRSLRMRPSGCISTRWGVALNDAPLGTAFTVSVDVRPRPDHRDFGRRALPNTVRARGQWQQRRRRLRAAGHVFPPGRQGGRRADRSATPKLASTSVGSPAADRSACSPN